MSADAPSLDALGEAFTTRTLVRAHWIHEAHLRVGLWHLVQYGEAEALERLRIGICALNDAHGVVNSERSGYHETITWAFLRLLADVRRQHPPSMAPDALATLVVAALSDRAVLHRHYSPELLASPHARRMVMAPDRAPLP